MEENKKEKKNIEDILRDMEESLVSYFGEDRVEFKEVNDDDDYELEGMHIFLIHYPELIITNNKEESHKIFDLYVRLAVDDKGSLSPFSMIRTSFTEEELKEDYSHSHLPGINSFFRNPCLGSGPIAGTLASLAVEYDYYLFELFIRELDNYVHHESLEGFPYRYMSSITIRERSLVTCDSYISCPFFHIEDVIKKILTDDDLPLFTTNNIVYIGMSFESFWIYSNNKIKQLQDSGIINASAYNTIDVVVVENSIYRLGTDTNVVGKLERLIDNFIPFTFKGSTVGIKLMQHDLNIDDNEFRIINPSYVLYIYNKLTYLLNSVAPLQHNLKLTII